MEKQKQKDLMPEDIMMVAVKHEVSERYVKMVIYSEREFTRSQKAKDIAADLELLASENINHRHFKQTIIVTA